MLSLQGKHWHIVGSSTYNSINDVLADFMVTRGLNEVMQATLTDSPVVQRAAERVWQAIERKETVYIFGDYDCDGITSAAQILRFFLRNGTSPIVYIPHRIRDGYGLQAKHIPGILQSKATLLITVDTGISSAAEISELQRQGIDVIVTDHHHVPTQVPDAFAIIHPDVLLPGTSWKPAGAGVVYNFISALEQGKNWPEMEYDTMLAMIGTIGDIVPLTLLNRDIVRNGLHAINTYNNTPIHTLLQKTGRSMPVSSTDIAFGVVPYINAAGRLQESTIALRALLGSVECIDELITINTLRKELVEQSLIQALEHQLEATKEHPYLAWYEQNTLHHGVLGLLASKLTEQRGVPSIVATHNADGTMSASLRSSRHYNVVEGLERIQPLLLRYGGHSQAAGLTCDSTQFTEVISALHNDITSNSAVQNLQPELQVDAIVDPGVLTMSASEAVQSLEPFGAGNPEPVFVIQNCTLTEPRWVGSTAAHLQVRLQNQRAICFNAAYLTQFIEHPLDIALTMNTKEWQGKKQLELKILDAKKAE